MSTRENLPTDTESLHSKLAVLSILSLCAWHVNNQSDSTRMRKDLEACVYWPTFCALAKVGPIKMPTELGASGVWEMVLEWATGKAQPSPAADYSRN